MCPHSEFSTPTMSIPTVSTPMKHKAKSKAGGDQELTEETNTNNISIVDNEERGRRGSKRTWEDKRKTSKKQRKRRKTRNLLTLTKEERDGIISLVCFTFDCESSTFSKTVVKTNNPIVFPTQLSM